MDPKPVPILKTDDNNEFKGNDNFRQIASLNVNTLVLSCVSTTTAQSITENILHEQLF